MPDDGDPINDMAQLVITAQAESASRGVLSMWTVSCRPTDFPTMHVARRNEVGGKSGAVHVCGDVLQADGNDAGLLILRVVLERAGLTCITRSDSDPPHIVETWL